MTGARWIALGHGTRFGLLLQLAVGPVCLFVMQTGLERGLLRGLAAVAGVACVDALYVAVAGIGVTRWAESSRTRRALQYGGALVIAVFGLDLLASAFGHALIPAVVGRGAVAGDSFLSAVLLTASNPLTILFWAGVFGAKVVREGYDRIALGLFSTGCVLATVGFLSLIACAGALLGRVAPAALLVALNVAVGCALLYFAVRLALQRLSGPDAARRPFALGRE